MEYFKPEVELIGSAVKAIQNPSKTASGDDPNLPHLTTSSAYDLDE